MTINPLFYEYIAKEEHYLDGDIVIEEGSSGHWICVLLEGQVKVKKRTPKGLVTLNTLKAGSIFGEMVFFQTAKVTRFASVLADGPVVVGVLDTERLTRDLNALSPRLRKLISSLLRRRAEATQKLINLMLQSS